MDRILSLNLRVDDEVLAVPVLSATYQGNGGAEGAPELKGRPKPWLFGRAVSVEPVLINAVDSVYQVSAYGPVSAITGCFERGAGFGAAAADYATYAALVAATIQPGQWATCLAQGMVRLGAPAAGLITLDVDGDSGTGFLRKTGEILSRIASARGAGASVDAASLAAIDVTAPRNIALYLTEQVTLIDLAQRLAAPLNAAAGASLTGKLFVARVAFGTSATTLDAQARQMPPVAFIGEEPVFAPYKRVMLGAARTWRVHGSDEIAFAAPLYERGLWDAATVYYEGNIVTRGDGSRWLYIATTGQAGVTPGTNAAVWSMLAPATSLNAKGAYSATTTYSVGDIVLWRVSDGGDGNTYIRIDTGDTTGVAPSNGTKWALFLEGGVEGPPGTDGVDGADGKLVEFVWKRAATQPATPTGGGIPFGWSDDPPADDGNPLWMTKAKQELDGTLVAGEVWSTPIRHDGKKGVDGATALTFTKTAAVEIDPLTMTIECPTAGGGWGTNGAYSDQKIPGGCLLSFRAPQYYGSGESFMVGINSDPEASNHYNDIDHAIYFTWTGSSYRWEIFESDTNPGVSGAWSPFSTFGFRYDPAAGTVEYYVDGISVRTLSGVPANKQFAIDMAFAYKASVTAISFTAAGVSGGSGAPGSNNAIVYAYQRSASGAPSLPTATATYDFGAKTLSGLNAGWSATIPAGSNPLYVTAATASSTGATDTIAPAEWSSAVLLAQSGGIGNDGLNSASIFLYRRAASTPLLPSVTSTYTFATGTLAGQNNGWSQTILTTNGDPLWVTTATAISTSATDDIPSTEWAAARILAQDGAQGPAGYNNATITIYKRAATTPALPSVAATYTFSTKALSGLNNGWGTSLPADDGNPLFAAIATASSTSDTDTISANEWTSPVAIVKSGDAGLQSASVFLFKRSATTPVVPSTTSTYTFATAVLTGQNNGWAQSIPAYDGNQVWMISASAASIGATDTIASTEWSTPQILAQDGADGIDGVSPVLVMVAPASQSFATTASGDAKSGTLPLVFGVTARRGGSLLTITSITITGTPTGGTWDVSGSTVRLTALGSGATQGEATFTVVAGGETITGNTASFATVQDAAAVNQVSRSWTPTTSDLNSASPVTTGTNIAANARSNGTLDVSYKGSVAPTGAVTADQYRYDSSLQYSTDGGTNWTAVSGSSLTSTISEDSSGGEPGVPKKWTKATVGMASTTLTGLGADAAVLLRVRVNKSSGGYSNWPTVGGIFNVFANGG